MSFAREMTMAGLSSVGSDGSTWRTVKLGLLLSSRKGSDLDSSIPIRSRLEVDGSYVESMTKKQMESYSLRSGTKISLSYEFIIVSVPVRGSFYQPHLSLLPRSLSRQSTLPLIRLPL